MVKVNDSGLVLGLSALLVSQLVLTCVVLRSKDSIKTTQNSVLSFNPKRVSKIVIEEREKSGNDREKDFEKTTSSSTKRLDLVMTAKADWKIPALADFPASSDMIHQSLDSLLEIKNGSPIGTTSDAQERHSVSPKNFRRAVTLFDGDKVLVKVYMGNTLADNKTAFRSANENSVYADSLSADKFTANPNYWIDKRAASIKLKKIESIDMGSFRLDNFEKSWNLVEKTKSDLLDAEAVTGMVYPIANCKIVYVLGTKAEKDFNLDHPFLSFRVRLKDGLVRQYKISREKTSGYYVAAISEFPWFCIADKRTIDKIVAWKPESLRRQHQMSTSKPKGVDLKGMLKRQMTETLQSVEHDANRPK